MHCIVTAGPTYESLDQVRRLTNHSTGRLGAMLANSLDQQGFSVTLYRGYYATFRDHRPNVHIREFTDTQSLLDLFESDSSSPVSAIFHAAAVSDFRFGQIFKSQENGMNLTLQSGKFSTREGTLLAELKPTPKVINRLRDQFSKAIIVGWKYEVEGSKGEVIQKGIQQLKDNNTNACVVNGPAYGDGFGVIVGNRPIRPCQTPEILYSELEKLIPSSI